MPISNYNYTKYSKPDIEFMQVVKIKEEDVERMKWQSGLRKAVKEMEKAWRKFQPYCQHYTLWIIMITERLKMHIL